MSNDILSEFGVQLQNFLNSPCRNQWIYTRKFKVYVRKSIRFIDREMVKSLDLAAVEVYPKFQRKGDFKKILEVCQHYNPYLILYIENVLNEKLNTYLRKHKRLVKIDASSFYLEKKHDSQDNYLTFF